jgi:hypothetical protein
MDLAGRFAEVKQPYNVRTNGGGAVPDWAMARLGERK